MMLVSIVQDGRLKLEYDTYSSLRNFIINKKEAMLVVSFFSYKCRNHQVLRQIHKTRKDDK